MKKANVLSAGLVFLTTAMLMMPVLRPWVINLVYGDLLLFAVLGFFIVRGQVPVHSVLQENRAWFVSGCFLMAGFMLSDLVDGGRGGAEGLFGMAQYLCVILLIPVFFLGAPNPRAASWGLLAGAWINVLAAVLTWKYDLVLPGTVAGRLSGLLGNPNTLAKNLAIPLVLFLNGALQATARRAVWGYAGVLACVAGSVLAASFGGILALGVGAVAYLAVLRKRRILLAIGILGVAGYVLAASGWLTGLNAKLDERMGRFYAYSSVTSLGSSEVKIALMRESLETVLENPFVGRGIKSQEEDGYADLFMHKVHNWPLIVCESGGILSFAGVVGILCYLVAFIGHRASRCRSETRAVAWAALVVFLVNMQTNTHMYARFWWVALFVVLRMVWDEAKPHGNPAGRPVAPGGAVP